MTMAAIPLLTPVALTEDVPEKGLTRGQMGTVVELLECDGEQAVLVEFVDDEGQTLAMADLKPAQLLALHRQIRAA
jgi:hypothetical protein